MYRLTVQRIGDSLGVTLPEEMAERLQVGEGDLVYAVGRDGAFVLMPHDTEFEETMEAFEEVRREFRDAFRELAK